VKHRDHEKWAQDIHERQRNIVFPDTARNFGGFWGGLYRQTLTPFQVVGFIVLIVFYILFAVCVVFMTWPPGKGSMVSKIVSGYWLNFLLCIPLLIFFLALRSSLRPPRAPTIPPHGRQRPLS
jgi:hypothetical protein